MKKRMEKIENISKQLKEFLIEKKYSKSYISGFMDSAIRKWVTKKSKIVIRVPVGQKYILMAIREQIITALKIEIKEIEYIKNIEECIITIKEENEIIKIINYLNGNMYSSIFKELCEKRNIEYKLPKLSESATDWHRGYFDARATIMCYSAYEKPQQAIVMNSRSVETLIEMKKWFKGEIKKNKYGIYILEIVKKEERKEIMKFIKIEKVESSLREKVEIEKYFDILIRIGANKKESKYHETYRKYIEEISPIANKEYKESIEKETIIEKIEKTATNIVISGITDAVGKIKIEKEIVSIEIRIPRDSLDVARIYVDYFKAKHTIKYNRKENIIRIIEAASVKLFIETINGNSQIKNLELACSIIGILYKKADIDNKPEYRQGYMIGKASISIDKVGKKERVLRINISSKKEKKEMLETFVKAYSGKIVDSSNSSNKIIYKKKESVIEIAREMEKLERIGTKMRKISLCREYYEIKEWEKENKTTNNRWIEYMEKFDTTGEYRKKIEKQQEKRDIERRKFRKEWKE